MERHQPPCDSTVKRRPAPSKSAQPHPTLEPQVHGCAWEDTRHHAAPQSSVSRYRVSPRNPTQRWMLHLEPQVPPQPIVVTATLRTGACLAEDHVLRPQGTSHHVRAQSTVSRHRLSPRSPTPVMESSLGAASAITAPDGASSVTHGCALKCTHIL